MDEYYQNGPLPAWPGWYVQHLPHWYHAATVALTLVVELVLVWAVFLPRRCAPRVLRDRHRAADRDHRDGELRVPELSRARARRPAARRRGVAARAPCAGARRADAAGAVRRGARRRGDRESLALGWSSTRRCRRSSPRGSRASLALPARALEPFRIANAYGLFATMTEARYEIEFQGSRDGGDVDRVSVPLQAAGSARATGHLRAVPAALRVESLVRVARAVAAVAVGGARAGAAARGKPERARALPRDPFDGKPPRWCARCSGSTGSPSGDEARDRRLVAAAGARAVRRHRLASRRR